MTEHDDAVSLDMVTAALRADSTDVAIYARGPHAYLFQGTMEENSIYWVMAKALGLW